MKPSKSTLQSFGIFLKSKANSRKHFHFISFLSTLFIFLFTSFSSFAREIKTNAAAPLKALTSPFVGSETIRANLYLLNNNNTTILADGVLSEYNNLYHDSVTMEDAYKMTNIKENLGLTRYGRMLAVERRPIIQMADTLFLKLWKTSNRNYQLQFETTNLNHPGMQAFLEDAYLSTSLSLALNGITKVNFSVNNDEASANIDRFRIVYRAGPSSTLPVSFTSLRGYQLNNKISIDWKVENEINIEKYEIERSSNGTDFIQVNAMAPAKSGNTGNYSWIDNNPANGNNFYRIKSLDRDGTKKFSIIVKVSTAKINAGSITIYPNPIRGNMVNLQFTNQAAGVYQVRMFNTSGQAVYTGRMTVNSSSISQTFFANNKLSGGIYQLEIKAPDNTVNIQQAVVQE